MTIMKDFIEQAVEACDDWRAQGRRSAEANINTFEAFGVAPLDLIEFAYGMYEYFCEYLGFAPQEEGEALDNCGLSEEEDEPYDGIGSYVVGKDNVAKRVMLIQLADNLIREFSEDFPFEYMNEVGPAPLMYWFREGVPEGGMDWDWLALYCYDGIAEAYNYVRETWLPKLPALSWK